MREDLCVMDGVAEYCEEMEVYLARTNGKYLPRNKDQSGREGRGRLVVKALNEGGHNSTEVDLEQLLAWVAKNRPELYGRFI